MKLYKTQSKKPSVKEHSFANTLQKTNKLPEITLKDHQRLTELMIRAKEIYQITKPLTSELKAISQERNQIIERMTGVKME